MLKYINNGGIKMNTNNKIIIALGYFAVFIAPVILPLIIWLVTHDQLIKKHALRATVWQAFPFLAGILFVIALGMFGLINKNGYQLNMVAIILVGVICLASLIFFMMNLVAGVKALLD